MSFSIYGKLVVLGIALLMSSACGGNAIAPSNAFNTSETSIQRSSADSGGVTAADTTSILKLLTKDVTIGSTVDPKNGDMGPRAISVVEYKYGNLKKGQVLVCNFEDSSGTAGNGTTIEQLDPAPNSKPKTFLENSKIKGCDGDAITGGDQVYATGLNGGVMSWINQKGQLKKSYGPPITQPLGDGAAPSLSEYAPDYVFIGNADTGGLDSISLGGYGTSKVLEVVNGFDVNKGSGWSALGPSGIGYSCGAPPGSRRCSNQKPADTLFVADGACNAVIAINHASSLLEKDEVTIGSGCKKFACKYPTITCATLVKAGSPLNKPVAMTVLPNGNLIVANTGNNTLVEMTPKGQVLDRKIVDKSKTPGIYGVAAIGKTDSTTSLFYTDINTNTLHELEQP
jgi:hypothetical protein